MRRDIMFRGHWPAVAVSLAVMAGVSACSFTAPPEAQGDGGLSTAYQHSPAGGGHQQAGVDRGQGITGLPWFDRSNGAVLSSPAPPNRPPLAPDPRVPSPQYVERALPWLTTQPPMAPVSGQRSQTVHVPLEWHLRPGDDAPAIPAPPAPPTPPNTAAAPAAPAPPAPPPPPKTAAAPAVHLASYRSRADAMSGWTILRDKYPQLLASAGPILEDADLGDKGLYVRLFAGPFDNASARAVCRDILARGGWCRQVSVQP